MAENCKNSLRLQLESILNFPNRSDAYNLLLHFHRLSDEDASIMDSLLLFSPSLFPKILNDSHSANEEIAVLAMKSLGFMLYHPSLVAGLSDSMAQLALDSINRLIISTSMKAVCNLGVWCFTIQQLNASVIKSKSKSIINSITYALNNPFGSLSVTYEATQAVIKLTSQIPDEMKQTSEMWSPQIYKRLLSINKTEYDMAERCLHKISSLILPPQILLSKQVASDLKKNNMLESMADLVYNEPKKMQALNAWGWFISLLGFDSSDNNNLINEMLKIVEKTFTDRDPQVQIATLASWRHLIDAIEPQIINSKQEISSDNSLRSLVKKIKLILVPLKGIMSNKCHLSVHTCSFNIWCYFLHKLDYLINQPLILETSFGSILEVILSTGSEMPLWNSCIDLFHEYILSNSKENGLNTDTLLAKYCIKWLHWDLSFLDFNLKIIGFITNSEKLKDKSVENRILAIRSGLKIFRSLLKGVRNELKSTKACENTIFNSIKSILKFIKEICDASWCDESIKLCLEFIKSVWEELESPVLNSYKISMDIDYIKELQNIKSMNSTKFSSLGIREIFYKDLISPMEYLIFLYFSAGNRMLNGISMENLGFLDSSLFLLTNFEFVVSLLYMQIKKPFNDNKNLLRIWNHLTKGLKEHISHITGKDSENYTFNLVHGFLIYPLFLFTSTDNTRNPLKDQNELDIELIIEVYKSLNTYFNHDFKNSFFEGLCKMLVRTIDENNDFFIERVVNYGISKSHNSVIFSIVGEITIQVLENTIDLRNKEGLCCNIKIPLMLVSRFFKFLVLNLKSIQEDELTIAKKFFAALNGLIDQFELRKDILMFFEVLSDPISQVMLSCTSTMVQNLVILWTHVLDCLKRNQHLISCYSTLFKTHSSLFQTALNHPDIRISAATSAFLKLVSQLDKSSPNNVLSFEDFDVLSERFRVSASNKGIKEAEETGFISISTGLRRKRLKITKYKTNGKRLEICKTYGNLIGSKVGLNHGLESKDTRKPEDILQMLRRH